MMVYQQSAAQLQEEIIKSMLLVLLHILAQHIQTVYTFQHAKKILYVTSKTSLTQGDVPLWNLSRVELQQKDDSGNVKQSRFGNVDDFNRH